MRSSSYPLLSSFLGGPLLVALLTGGPWLGCSAIQFELGPYAVRDLQVVYSVQEDITFFSWQLRDDCDPDRVRFELFRNGVFQPIDLGSTLFPADPYACQAGRLCFQYQLRGPFDLEAQPRPLRSIHEHEGVFAGPAADLWVATTTVAVDPIALGHNREIDPQLDDWFVTHDISLHRHFEWRLVDTAAQETPCPRPPNTGWETLSPPVAVAYSWVEQPTCFALRTRPADGAGAFVSAYLVPSAETRNEQQTYVPPVATSPIVYGVLLDLFIATPERCQDVTATLVDAITGAIDARGTNTRLGVYLPLSSPGGVPLTGCGQDPERRYPVGQMMQDAVDFVSGVSPAPTRLVWIYANNIEAVPEQRQLDALAALTIDLHTEYGLDLFSWAIGSATVLSVLPWDATTGWRPIEDVTLYHDISAVAEATLPFLTMRHDSETEVPIGQPIAAKNPQYFKICRCTPTRYRAIGIVPGQADFGVSSPAVVWPSPGAGTAYYQIDLGVQHLVPNAQYVEHEIEIVVEVCERFCGHPFRARNGRTYPAWNDTPNPEAMEKCQWL